MRGVTAPAEGVRGEGEVRARPTHNLALAPNHTVPGTINCMPPVWVCLLMAQDLPAGGGSE